MSFSSANPSLYLRVVTGNRIASFPILPPPPPPSFCLADMEKKGCEGLGMKLAIANRIHIRDSYTTSSTSYPFDIHVSGGGGSIGFYKCALVSSPILPDSHEEPFLIPILIPTASDYLESCKTAAPSEEHRTCTLIPNCRKPWLVASVYFFFPAGFDLHWVFITTDQVHELA